MPAGVCMAGILRKTMYVPDISRISREGSVLPDIHPEATFLGCKMGVCWLQESAKVLLQYSQMVYICQESCTEIPPWLDPGWQEMAQSPRPAFDALHAPPRGNLLFQSLYTLLLSSLKFIFTEPSPFSFQLNGNTLHHSSKSELLGCLQWPQPRFERNHTA